MYFKYAQKHKFNQFQNTNRLNNLLISLISNMCFLFPKGNPLGKLNTLMFSILETHFLILVQNTCLNVFLIDRFVYVTKHILNHKLCFDSKTHFTIPK